MHFKASRKMIAMYLLSYLRDYLMGFYIKVRIYCGRKIVLCALKKNHKDLAMA